MEGGAWELGRWRLDFGAVRATRFFIPEFADSAPAMRPEPRQIVGFGAIKRCIIGRILEFTSGVLERDRGFRVQRGVSVCCAQLPPGFAQHAGEAEARFLRSWLRGRGAKWSGARGFLSFARGVHRSVTSRLMRRCDLRFASCVGIFHWACKTWSFCAARDGDCSVSAVSTRFDSALYSMDLRSLILTGC